MQLFLKINKKFWTLDVSYNIDHKSSIGKKNFETYKLQSLTTENFVRLETKLEVVLTLPGQPWKIHGKANKTAMTEFGDFGLWKTLKSFVTYV